MNCYDDWKFSFHNLERPHPCGARAIDIGLMKHDFVSVIATVTVRAAQNCFIFVFANWFSLFLQVLLFLHIFVFVFFEMFFSVSLSTHNAATRGLCTV